LERVALEVMTRKWAGPQRKQTTVSRVVLLAVFIHTHTNTYTNTHYEERWPT